MPKISVVMPVYNSAKTLPRSVESIMNQTFTDFEFIIVNEFESNDGSRDIIEAYAAKDKRVKLKQLTRHEGIANSLNIGMQMAEGQYIARMDADDYSYPVRFERQVSYMDAHPECVLCGTYFRQVAQGLEPILIRNPCTSEEIKVRLLFHCAFGHPTVMLRRKAFIANEWRYDSSHRAEDFDLWTRIEGEISNLPEVLVDYNWHGGNLSITNKEIMDKDACEIVKAQMRRRLHISTNNYHDLMFNLDLIASKPFRFDLIHEGLRLLLEIEGKNSIYRYYNSEILANCLCDRWNRYVKVLFSRFADERLGDFSIANVSGTRFSDSVAFHFGVGRNKLIEEIKFRLAYLRKMIKRASRVLVFGVGEKAKSFFSENPMMLNNVVLFSDNNGRLWGQEFFQKKVCALTEISPLSYDWIAISSEKYYNEILDSLVSTHHIPRQIIADLGILRMIKSIQEEE